jgi:hypothetical protein
MYLQGSYALHTTVRPVDDDAEYDVDIILAADFQDYMDSLWQSGHDVIRWLQDQIESISLYEGKTQRLEHCVRVQYESDGQRFHLDVVPAHRPDTTDGEILIPPSWDPSNPKGFAKWFNEQQARCERVRHITRLLKYWRNLQGSAPNSMVLTTLVGRFAPGDEAYRTLDHALIQTMREIHAWLDDNYHMLFGVEVPNPSLADEDLARNWTGVPSFVNQLSTATEIAKDAAACRNEEETIELWNSPELFDGHFPTTVRGLGQAERDAREAMKNGSLAISATGAVHPDQSENNRSVPDNGGFYGQHP